MNTMIKLKDILDFLGDRVKKVYGNPANIEVKYLKSPEDIDEYTLDWINVVRSDKQAIAEHSRAKVILANEDVLYSSVLKEQGKVIIIVENPKHEIARVGNEFFTEKIESMINSSAVIDTNAKIGSNVFIGSNSSIGKCKIGNNTKIFSNVTINKGVHIGNNVIIKPGAVIGFEGFGFERKNDGKLLKFPQLGRLIIHDDVEIGSNTCIDKGSLADVIIGRGSKINNLCHIAHNVTIGENVVVTAQVNISGSTIIGDNVWIGPNASLRGHQQIKENATIGMGAVVTKDVPAGETWIGNPAKKMVK